MTRRWWLRGSLVAIVLTLVLPALAEANCHRPQAQARTYQPVGGLGVFSVFGARTLDAGQFSVGAGYLGEEAVCQQLEGPWDLDFHTFFIPLAYGVTDRLMVGVDLPYSIFEADRARFIGSGLDDINVGVTYRFLDEGVGRPALGVVGFAALPTADKHRGLGTGLLDAGFKLILSKSLLPGLVGHVNVGYTFVGKSDEFKRRDEVTGGVGVEYAITPRLSALVEFVGNTNREDGREPNGDPIRTSDIQAEARGGFRYIFNDWLMASLGVRGGLTSDAPNKGVYALVTATWPPRRGVAAPTSAPPGGGAAVPGALAPGAAVPGAGAPGPGGPGAGAPGAAPPGAGAPGAGAPGAGGPGAGAPGAGAPGAGAIPPGAAAPGAGGPGAGVPGAGAPGAGAAVSPTVVASLTRQGVLDLHFAFDRYDLTEESKGTLQALGAFLTQNREGTMTIEGHADERGTSEYNLALGEKRAQAVKDYLVSLGVSASRLSTISYGKERPLDPGHDELSWALNRRAHFLLRAR